MSAVRISWLMRWVIMWFQWFYFILTSCRSSTIIMQSLGREKWLDPWTIIVHLDSGMTKNLVRRESHGFLFTASLINYCLHAGLSPNLRPDLPYLFIWGTKDPTALPSVIPKSREYIPRYQDIALEGRHHWLMIEAKDEITERIVKWLEGLSFGGLEKL